MEWIMEHMWDILIFGALLSALRLCITVMIWYSIIKAAVRDAIRKELK